MRANDTTRRSAGVAGRVLDSEIGMKFVRRHMSWLLSIWLVCQVTALAAPVVLASSGAGTVDELCTCPGGDHETCPMHHGTQSDPSDRPAPGVCGIKACSSPVDVALLSMAGGAGVLWSSAQFEYPLGTAPVFIQEPASLDQPAPNHTPPPRL